MIGVAPQHADLFNPFSLRVLIRKQKIVALRILTQPVKHRRQAELPPDFLQTFLLGVLADKLIHRFIVMLDDIRRQVFHNGLARMHDQPFRGDVDKTGQFKGNGSHPQ